MSAGEQFVELEWDGAPSPPGTLFGWLVERRPLGGPWSVTSGVITPGSTGDPGPYHWIDLDVPPQVREYRVVELRDVEGLLVGDWVSNVVTADSDAVVPRFAQAGGLVVVEAEAWHSRAPGVSGKAWTTDPAPPADAIGDVLVATPVDGSGTCPSPLFAPLCPRLDYRIVFEQEGLHHVFLRGFATSTDEDEVIVGLDGVPLELASTAEILGAWSFTGTGAPVALWVPSAGEHELNVWMSEDGVRIDRLLLTTDAGFVPTPPGLPEDPGPPASARLQRTFVTVLQQSECSEPVIAPCPTGYEVVGGGIDFGGKSTKCDSSSEQSHDKFFGFSSYPEGNGWYCRVESRVADCYAVCAHRETTGILATQRSSTAMVDGLASVDAFCPAGTTRIGGGYHSESFWETPKRKEEYKVLGSYPIPGGWRCDDKSEDHYGACHALCVDDAEIASLGIEEPTAPLSAEVVCPAGYRPVGAGFSYCSTLDCVESLDEGDARPRLETDTARCLVGFKSGSEPVEAPDCSAVCMEEVTVYVPEPRPVVHLLFGLVALARLVRSPRARPA